MSPRITISYNRFLDPIFTKAYQVDNPEHIPMEDGLLFEKVEIFREEWKKQKSAILAGMKNTLGLEFYPNTIDVSIVRALRGGFSSPLTISALVPTERFVDVLTHELLHVLITDSTSASGIGLIRKKLYGNVEPRLTRNHILVHAAHQDIYLNVLNDPKRLADDIKKCERNPAYKKAWDIVEERGCQNILDEFKAKVKA